ncbi:MAG: PhzF family phenazine biosynthesis protein [Deltaproteobacteria bacterium]|jgi:PhzF family phenazine biosynthesis protein|nr:PhzF family phenazine biosynthesis protein [Deltaproteobacteria bacterium]
MKQYVVDAFTDKVFKGNPAAICILDDWLPDEVMMNIALENNLSETAYAVKRKDGYKLRWFALGGEIDLCGHATLACSHVVLNFMEKGQDRVVFDTLSGDLIVNKKDDLYEMDFPAFDLKPVPVTEKMVEVIGVRPREAYMGRDLLCIFEDESVIRKCKPDLVKALELDGLLLHISAQGKDTDCVSRTFAPKMNTPEDPVCGSGHCHIVPYWAKKLGKADVVAYQASPRGGTLYCSLAGNRVKLRGKAALFSIADIFID